MTANPAPHAPSGDDDDAIAAVRAFNRVYTRRFGLLGRGLLGSAYSLTEARVLYELAHRDKPTASDIARDLDLDLGYLSRMLARLEGQAQIERTRSQADGRQQHIHLTRKGRRTFASLDIAARRQVAELLAPLTGEQRTEFLRAMGGLHRLLQPVATGAPHLPAPVAASEVRLRPLRVGDVGWITQRQGLLYAQEYGWDLSYEALVAEILAGFVKNFAPAFEGAWIAERDGAVVGSVFLVRASPEVAKLRLLYVEPAARGLGLGSRLVRECLAFARSCGYRKVTLWTNDILVAARRIYEAEGFHLVHQEPHRSFGKNLVGQTWELEL